MMRIQRKPSENLRVFWLRFFKLHGRLAMNNAALPSTVLFSRSIGALKLSPPNRPMVATALDARAQDPTTIDLEEVALACLFACPSRSARKVRYCKKLWKIIWKIRRMGRAPTNNRGRSMSKSWLESGRTLLVTALDHTLRQFADRLPI